MKRTVLVVLGAGRPVDGFTPSAQRMAGQDVNVIEWQIAALGGREASIELVSGYGASDTVQPKGDVRVHLNTESQQVNY